MELRDRCLQIGRWEEESLPFQSLNLATVELKAGMLSSVSCQMRLRRPNHFPPLLASHGSATILTSKRKLQEVGLECTLSSCDHCLSKGNGHCPSVHNLYEVTGSQGFDSA